MRKQRSINMLKCRYCGKECKNDNSLRNHERLCRQNPNRDLTPYERGHNPLAAVHKFGAVGRNEGHESKDDVFNRECPHCHKWFRPAQIGGHIARCSKVHNEDRRAIRCGVVLDITVSELDEYMQHHTRCEICGRSVDEVVKYNGKGASKRLCVDHDHVTNRFRGMLCQSCNRQLGWYEKYRDTINLYLGDN